MIITLTRPWLNLLSRSSLGFIKPVAHDNRFMLTSFSEIFAPRSLIAVSSFFPLVHINERMAMLFTISDSTQIQS